MKFGKRGLGSGWEPRPTVSSTLHFPLWQQPSSADGVGKSDSQLACLRGQGDREQGPVPATQPHPSRLAGSSHGPRVGQGPGAPQPWVGSPWSGLPLPTPGEPLTAASTPLRCLRCSRGPWPVLLAGLQGARQCKPFPVLQTAPGHPGASPGCRK